MQTLPEIDEELLEAVRALAKNNKMSLDDVIIALTRDGLESLAVARTSDGFPVLPRLGKGHPVTMELVNQLRDELP
ncbi:CopG family transcriptional regulator [Pseudoduganella sp.]|uniref:CopG family transcriptional regulator n=1 Tax=Pseudoduganella sp. TaxID=1880898 RepID=UPI0035B090F5